MPPPIRQRAAALLSEWAERDAQPTSTRVAPVPEYYQDPQQSAVIDSATDIGGTLHVSFNGAGGTETTTCGASYYPTTVESSSAVVIYLVKVSGPFPTGENTGCDGVGAERSVPISLHGPLSNRQVIDLISGQLVPRR